jgi:hypothetical protein
MEEEINANDYHRASIARRASINNNIMPSYDKEKQQEKRVPFAKRDCITRWLCCAICEFPAWLAYILWFIFVAVIICIIVIGAMLASFKVPSIDFVGLNTTLPNGIPQIQFSGTGFIINIGLILNIINDNVLGVSLSNINATVYISNLYIYLLIN